MAARPAEAAPKRTSSTTSRNGSCSRRDAFGAIHIPQMTEAASGSATARTTLSQRDETNPAPAHASAASISSSSRNRTPRFTAITGWSAPGLSMLTREQ